MNLGAALRFKRFIDVTYRGICAIFKLKHYIGKGKVHKPFEFGCKVSIVTNLNPAPGGHFILSSQALHGKPYDGHTLKGTIKNVEAIIGREPLRGFVDKGYVGHKYDGLCKIYRSGQKQGVTAKI